MPGDEVLDFAFEVKKEDVTPEGYFKGLASTFGNVDSGGDVVMPGAFMKTIEKGGRNGTGVAMLWMHRPDEPIGVWNTLKESKAGLVVEGQLTLGATRADDAHKLLRAGAVRGLSIGFTTVVREIDDKKKVRYLKEVDLWEISVVTFPMNKLSKVTGVKSVREAKTPRELERALREAGFSNNDAKYLTGLCKHGLRDEDELLSALRGHNAEMEILQSIRNINKMLTA